uniref:Tudor domain-containing protein n=2 Tax=Pseudictyota dubia TaxID=2749911 RepID=A0A7R9VG67_9STRA
MHVPRKRKVPFRDEKVPRYPLSHSQPSSLETLSEQSGCVVSSVKPKGKRIKTIGFVPEPPLSNLLEVKMKNQSPSQSSSTQLESSSRPSSSVVASVKPRGRRIKMIGLSRRPPPNLLEVKMKNQNAPQSSTCTMNICKKRKSSPDNIQRVSPSPLPSRDIPLHRGNEAMSLSSTDESEWEDESTVAANKRVKKIGKRLKKALPPKQRTSHPSYGCTRGTEQIQHSQLENVYSPNATASSRTKPTKPPVKHVITNASQNDTLALPRSERDLLRIGVGTRLEVYWSQYKTFYACTVKRWSFPPGRAYLVYDDGDEEDVEDLGAENFRILAGSDLKSAPMKGNVPGAIETCHL